MHIKKILKNSLFLIIQPLILNFISIFVIGYIARKLGEINYGKFIFASTFVLMFYGISGFGLRTITVRDIAENKSNLKEYFGKMLSLRLFLSVIMVLSIFISINIMGYPKETKTLVYLLSSMVIFMTVTTAVQDVFQALEEMKYVAYSQLVSGMTINILSICMLFLGHGLVGLVLAYCLGNLLGMLSALNYLFKYFVVPRMKLNFSFYWTLLRRGITFSVPGLLSAIGGRIGIVILSKISGDASVGIYGAANNLVEKLMIVPDGLCTAVFPALTVAFKNSKEEGKALFSKFFRYLFLFIFPLVFGISVLGEHIIRLIYGSRFVSSALILQLLIWWFFVESLNSFRGWAFYSVHKEKSVAFISLIYTITLIIANFIMIPQMKEMGLVIAMGVATMTSFFIYCFLSKSYLDVSFFGIKFFVKVSFANILMGSVLFFFRKFSLMILFAMGVAVYTLAVFCLRIIKIEEVSTLIKFIQRKK